MSRPRLIIYLLILLVLIITFSGCQPVQPLSRPAVAYQDPTGNPAADSILSPTQTTYVPLIRNAKDTSIASPTPDEPRVLPEIRSIEDTYVVEMGDSLASIASLFDVTVGMLVGANEITNPDLIEVGQTLVIPAPIRSTQGPGSKIIPDLELIYGPYAKDFDVEGFLRRFDSHLIHYSEMVNGQLLSGSEIIQLVAQEYSINPRLLIAILEYRSGWVTRANPPDDRLVYPIGNQDSWRTGLYLQLAWAADNLNRGYYLWKINGIGGWLLNTGEAIPIDPSINAGTAGVQQLFAMLDDRSNWQYDVSPDGFFKTYSDLFGYPFDYAYEPIIPDDLEQPDFQLPFEPGVYWAFTGGPHGGWGEGSAWAAIDFAPGYEGLGCVPTDYWVVAVADGLITSADTGRVVEDLNGDGNEGTGWSILYMHIEGDGRIQAGTYVKAGERIGHPSCEGGYSTGTHFHLARRYNGEWIPADQSQEDGGVPFNLEGWVSGGYGTEYDGYLTRDGETISAWEGFAPGNTIYR